MKRHDFIKKTLLGGLALPFLGEAMSARSGAQLGQSAARCDETPTAEEGPFSTHKPADSVTQNIVMG